MFFDIYQDKKKEWRFRIKSRNGKILAVSSESYDRKRGAVRAVFSIMDKAGTGKIRGMD